MGPVGPTCLARGLPNLGCLEFVGLHSRLDGVDDRILCLLFYVPLPVHSIRVCRYSQRRTLRR